MAASHFLLLLAQFYLACSGKNADGEFFLNPDAFSTEHFQQTYHQLSQLMRTECLSDRITVTFGKLPMLKIGILADQMTMEKGCPFNSVDFSHYSSSLIFEDDMCGSSEKVDSLSKRRTINNSVVISPPTVIRTSEVFQYSVSDQEDFDMLSSGSGEGAVMSDLHTITIPFTCVYPVSRPQHGFLSDSPTNSSSYHLRVFNNSKLVDPFQAMHSVAMGTTLYIQLRADPDGGGNHFFIQNCYFESEEGSLSSSTPYFIRNGCPIDPTVSFLEEHRTGKERLFNLKVHSLSGVKASVSCDLQPCSFTNSPDVSLPQCGSQMSYCASKFTGYKNFISVHWPYSLKGEECQQTAPCDCFETGMRNAEVQQWIVILIAIAAFSIGCLFMGVFWLIHSKYSARHETADSADSQQQPPEAHRKLMTSSTPDHVI